jgi:hypothetical protein
VVQTGLDSFTTNFFTMNTFIKNFSLITKEQKELFTSTVLELPPSAMPILVEGSTKNHKHDATTSHRNEYPSSLNLSLFPGTLATTPSELTSFDWPPTITERLNTRTYLVSCKNWKKWINTGFLKPWATTNK